MLPAAPPYSNAPRVALVDSLRGWALLGVVIGNYTAFAPPPPAHSPAAQALYTLVDVLFTNKSWTLLAVLFGYGFAVLMQHQAAAGRSPVGFFCRRMGWLLVLALLNSAFWWGDVLKDYAVLGVVLALVFYGRSTHTLLLTSAALQLLVPFGSQWVARAVPPPYSPGQIALALQPYAASSQWLQLWHLNLLKTYFYTVVSPHFAITLHLSWLSYMLLGYAAQRVDLFRRLPAHLPQLRRVFAASLLLSVASYLGLQWAARAQAPFLQVCRVEFWVIGSSMLAIAAGLSWLYVAGWLPAVFASWQVVGRLTLTNYLVQGVLSQLLFAGVGLGLSDTQPYWVYVALAGGVYLAQVGFSHWWLARYRYGPVEWVWRQLSYGRRLPLRRVATLAAGQGGSQPPGQAPAAGASAQAAAFEHAAGH